MVPNRTLPVLILIMALFPWPVYNKIHGAASTSCEFIDSTVASCTKKFFISAQLEGLPLGLRVLKLDENIITTIDDNAFLRTPLLRELSIAQNRLQTIHLDAFKDLHSLKKLNLSDNRLESFNEFLLDELSVEILDLSNNNFMYADGKIRFRSSSLMELYLRNCKIVSVNGMLKDLPSLVKVDLSSNYLVSLELPSFVPLTELKFVDLQNNHLKCDKPTQYLMEWFRKHEIKYEGPFCAVQRQEMLQRMQSLDKFTQKDIDENDLLKNNSLAKINASEVEEELVMGLFNKTYFKRCLLMDHEIVCHLLETCKESCNRMAGEDQKNFNLIHMLLFCFVCVVLGVVIGAIGMDFYKKKRGKRRGERQPESGESTQSSDADQLPDPIDNTKSEVDLPLNELLPSTRALTPSPTPELLPNRPESPLSPISAAAVSLSSSLTISSTETEISNTDIGTMELMMPEGEMHQSPPPAYEDCVAGAEQ